MKIYRKYLVLPVIMSMCALAFGCAKDFYTTAFRLEQTTVSGAHSAVHTYNQYYHAATNGVTDTNKLAKLNSQWQQVLDEAHKFGACAQVYDSALENYRTNSADTNKTAVTLAFEILGDEATNIENLVRFMINPNNPGVIQFSPLPPPSPVQDVKQ